MIVFLHTVFLLLKKILDTLANLQVDDYVAGFEAGDGTYFVAKYWKNGTEVNLTDAISMIPLNRAAENGN